MNTPVNTKNTLIAIVALFATTATFAQVGIGTTTPHASAALDVESTTKGFLPPRMTDVQRDAMGSPLTGMTIYNTTENCLQWYDGSFWFDACTGSLKPDPLPGTITLDAISDFFVASALDSNYLDSNGLPNNTVVAQLPGSATADSANGINDILIDIQGVLTTAGVTIKIPYTVATTATSLPAYSQLITIPASYTQNDTATQVSFSYPAQTNLAIGSGFIDATLQAVGANLQVVKLDLNSGFGANYLGFLLGKFTYALDAAGNVAELELRAIPGIPDKNIGDGVHDFLYLPIVSATGKTWLNNNLGANYANINKSVFEPSKQATARNDFNAYGSHFQWGRVADGHEIVNWSSATAGTVTTATSALSSVPEPINTNFITGSNWYNGTSPAPNDIWKDNTKTIYDPCPRGFRVPSETELNAERTSWTPLSTAGAHASVLKLTTAGLRDGASGGGLAGAGTTLFYWASTIATNNSRSVLNTNMHTSVRVAGGSIRCIQK